MPTFLIDPGRIGRRYQRPPWPYRLNSDSPQAQGLVRWWPLDQAAPIEIGPRKLSAGGSDLAAVSGMGVLPTPQPVGAAWNFNGSTEFLGSLDVAVTAVPLSFTIWAFPRAFAAAMACLGVYENADTSRFMLDIATGGTPQFFSTNSAGTNGTASAPSAAIANTWNFLGGTSAASNSRHCWINGAKGTESTTNVTPSGIGLTGIGADNGNLNNNLFFDGFLADGRIYNRVLRDAEMFAQWHPDTRWDLYWQPNKRTYFHVQGGGLLRRLVHEGLFADLGGRAA